MENIMIIVPNLGGGGQERIAALTSVILEKKYNIYFVVFDNTEIKYRVSTKAQFININIPNSDRKSAKVVNAIRRSIKVRVLKKKYNINYCISYGRTANIVNILSKRKESALVSVRNSSELEIGTRSILNCLIYKRSSVILCISEGQRRRLIQTFPQIDSKAYVIYNPCDLNEIEKKRQDEPSIEIKKDSIVCCGRLEKVKCYKNLFNAVSLAKEIIPDLSLVVIGEGKQREELWEYICQNGMESFIEIKGFMDNPFQIISRCSLSVFPSSREGFGNVLVEAMACAVPVISTDCEYGPREILSDDFNYNRLSSYAIEKYGILVPAFKEGIDHQPELEKIFADAIVKVMSDADLHEYLASAGKLRSEVFSVKEYENNLKNVLQKTKMVRRIAE